VTAAGAPLDRPAPAAAHPAERSDEALWRRVDHLEAMLRRLLRGQPPGDEPMWPEDVA